MKITRLETIWIDEQPNTMWLRIHTDEGLIGLGETFYVPRAVSAVIHDVFATLLIGRSPFDIERLWHNMFSTVNFFGYGGSETRAISAVDLFNVSAGQADPFFNVFVRQPLPGSDLLPGRFEAVLDLRNLLAQGYVPVVGPDGRTVYLVQSARSVRGGFAFVF